ncbi:hypothetical protein [Capsulimonas corticalis]|uniref:hypothetical protein n=1 Tax=Capsulimonas corticalis TaxID=2219043 RepID=UPI000E649E7A|nr:hypothetical protein [Capsulimonas corticalis]
MLANEKFLGSIELLQTARGEIVLNVDGFRIKLFVDIQRQFGFSGERLIIFVFMRLNIVDADGLAA